MRRPLRRTKRIQTAGSERWGRKARTRCVLCPSRSHRREAMIAAEKRPGFSRPAPACALQNRWMPPRSIRPQNGGVVRVWRSGFPIPVVSHISAFFLPTEGGLWSAYSPAGRPLSVWLRLPLRSPAFRRNPILPGGFSSVFLACCQWPTAWRQGFSPGWPTNRLVLFLMMPPRGLTTSEHRCRKACH